MSRRRSTELTQKQRGVLMAFALVPPGFVLRATDVKRSGVENQKERSVESIGRSTWALANRGLVERKDGGWRLTMAGVERLIAEFGPK